MNTELIHDVLDNYEECLSLQKIASEHGKDLSLIECADLWTQHSENLDANWMDGPGPNHTKEQDEIVWNCVKDIELNDDIPDISDKAFKDCLRIKQILKDHNWKPYKKFSHNTDMHEAYNCWDDVSDEYASEWNPIDDMTDEEIY